VKVIARTTPTHNPSGEVYWASGLRENLTSRSYGEGLETGRTLVQAPRQSFTRQLVFRAWKSGLHLATMTTTTKNSTLCYLYGRMVLILLTAALSSPLRATLWQHQHRELSLFRLVRHCQAWADHWFQHLFQSPLQLAAFLSRLCATAERLGNCASLGVKTEELREVGNGPASLFALPFQGTLTGVTP